MTASTLRWSLLFGLLMLPSALLSQPLRGLTSAGVDFYIGYSPGLRHPSTWTGIAEGLYALTGSFQDSNTVTISFFDRQTGQEFPGTTYTLRRGEARQVAMDRSRMAPTPPGEIVEFCAAHIQSRYPITVQVYQEGSSTGGLYSAIPSQALGTQYVIASYKNDTVVHNPGWLARDSSSSWFMIVAAFDSTRVTYVPTARTYGGTIGVNTGVGHDGKPHRVTKLLRRGQTWWVRSDARSDGDLSGSTVVSDRPVAVLAGQERAFLGNPTGVWASLDNDVRDVIVEQMTPYHAWGSDYPSIPFLPPADVARLLVDGRGDMYRLYGLDSTPTTLHVQFSDSAATRNVIRYQYPITEFYSVEGQVDITSEGRKPFYAVVYDKFQGQHDFDPGGAASQKGSKDILDEMTMVCPSDMNVIPLDHFLVSTVFRVPQQSTYRGYQFINVITNHDSLTKINVVYNSGATKPLSSYAKKRQFNISGHPELIGITYQLAPGNYMISGNTPFAVYSYGRTETQYKDGWGYAAPAGQSYADLSDSTAPRVTITPDCNSWDIHIADSLSTDRGIAYALLLEDPEGVYDSKPHELANMALRGSFVPGARSIDLSLHVTDSTMPASAALYIEDRGGHDTILTFAYQPPLAANKSLTFSGVVRDTCERIFIRNLLSVDAEVTSLELTGDTRFLLSGAPTLPIRIKPNDSLAVTICYSLRDTLRHVGRLTAKTECSSASTDLSAHTRTGVLSADDRLFEVTADTTCSSLRLEDIGILPMTVTGAMVSNAAFFFPDPTPFPLNLTPHVAANVIICYKGSRTQKDSVTIAWLTDVAAPFAVYGKPYSKVYVEAKSEVESSRRTELLPTMRLTPNPARARSIAHLEHANGGSLEIYDMLGARLRAIEAIGDEVEIPLDLGSFARGTYVVRLTSTAGTISKLLRLQ
jgi:hypothetical protein